MVLFVKIGPNQHLKKKQYVGVHISEKVTTFFPNSSYLQGLELFFLEQGCF